MDKQELYQSLETVEVQLQDALLQVQAMKEMLTSVVNNLELENKYVRERLQELEKMQVPTVQKEEDASARSQVQENLNHLYEDGFHICPSSYGAKREGECMFCLEILYRDS